MIYSWQGSARTPTALAVVGLWLLGVAVLWLVFAAHWVICLLLLVAIAPSVIDILRNRTATLEVDPQQLRWTSALRDGESTEIDHVRLDRRFDGGFRITLLHPNGSHTRLPPDVRPPAAELEAALAQAGISAERHPFSPF